MDFILNGVANGSVASALMQSGFDVSTLRPWIGQDGRSYVTVNTGGKAQAVPLMNTTATLRKDDWKILDEAIVKAAKPRLKAVADLRAAGLVYNIPNGMAKTVLETETQSDISAATISMDGLRESNADRPVFELSSLPLPIIHKDFSYSARQVMASRNGGSPLDTTTAELAARRVAEEAEKLLLGVADTYAYGGGTIYGYCNFASVISQTLSDPTESTWVPTDLLSEVLSMRAKAQAKYHFGPYMLYVSPGWDLYLDEDFSAAKGDNTVRERLKMIDSIQDVRTLDYLEDYDMVLVQMTSDVVREVVGMDITTVQWETKGGMQLNFKVMAILVPQLRADQNGNSGIVYGAVA
jgi:uncharacterized linocin/CFP29 family protein